MVGAGKSDRAPRGDCAWSRATSRVAAAPQTNNPTIPYHPMRPACECVCISCSQAVCVCAGVCCGFLHITVEPNRQQQRTSRHTPLHVDTCIGVPPITNCRCVLYLAGEDDGQVLLLRVVHLQSALQARHSILQVQAGVATHNHLGGASRTTTSSLPTRRYHPTVLREGQLAVQANTTQPQATPHSPLWHHMHACQS